MLLARGSTQAADHSLGPIDRARHGVGVTNVALDNDQPRASCNACRVADERIDLVAGREEFLQARKPGVTRAHGTRGGKWVRRRKKGAETMAGLPSRFIAEMALNQETIKEDPREKIKALRAEFAQRALDAANAMAARKDSPSLTAARPAWE